MPQWVGWVATLVFAISYFFRDPKSLRWIQALAALLWIAYGISIHARHCRYCGSIFFVSQTQGNRHCALKAGAAEAHAASRDDSAVQVVNYAELGYAA